MTDRYKVLTGTMIGGRYVDEGQVLTPESKFSNDDIEAALKAKVIEKVEADPAEDVEMTDAAPSLTTAHHTKRVVEAETKGDAKAAKEG